ncbi:uncharacterized protein LOC120255543 [Dioscorea cayenensis subsp. rotundata]|uniref:Uncharacterized protein LOC120255543 n=1 Tax=Dioscorea cayennensis subsp. rotundata TaxID=55577 RepID=A0AB40AWH2_DIOCR|nr:uncharacterized protein LOC120255543 [Dioscorea cayenensis subsp. rotundata]
MDLQTGISDITEVRGGGDPQSPLLFCFSNGDVLSSMFAHALSSKVLVGVPLGSFGRRCNLHYADDLLILTAGGCEDLRIIKLILYLFEGMSGLETNFSKTCLFSSQPGVLPSHAVVDTLQCKVGLLPVVYLGIPISGRRPRKQDWEGVILKVRKRLAAWKLQHLSLGGRLILVNSVLSAIPTYWMSIFRLPGWVVKGIDRIRRDFLWSGPDINHPGCRRFLWKKSTSTSGSGGLGDSGPGLLQ